MLRFFLVMAIGTAIPSMASRLAGKWTGTIETNGSRMPVILTINQQDGKLSGSIATGNGAKPATIDSAELHDDENLYLMSTTTPVASSNSALNSLATD